MLATLIRETKEQYKQIREEDITPEDQAWLLNFYREAMQSKLETQAELREYAKTGEYKESARQSREENAKRGIPYVWIQIRRVASVSERYFASIFFRHDNPNPFAIIAAFDQLASGENEVVCTRLLSQFSQCTC